MLPAFAIALCSATARRNAGSRFHSSGRDATLAMEMLEQSLIRLQTDHLDLWQIHGVSFDNDPDLAYRKGGVLKSIDGVGELDLVLDRLVRALDE